MYKITINRKKQSFTVAHIENKVSIKSVKRVATIKSVKKNINIDTVKRRINILGSSKRGLPGKNGVGVPEGGNPGNVLTRTVDGTAWQAFSASDKYFEQSFSVSNSVSVTHNLNKYPAVTVHDSAGDEVEGNIIHTNLNQLSVTFSAPFSGRITCN